MEDLPLGRIAALVPALGQNTDDDTELEEVITHTNIITTQLSHNITRKHNLKI